MIKVPEYQAFLQKGGGVERELGVLSLPYHPHPLRESDTQAIKEGHVVQGKSKENILLLCQYLFPMNSSHLSSKTSHNILYQDKTDHWQFWQPYKILATNNLLFYLGFHLQTP